MQAAQDYWQDREIKPTPEQRLYMSVMVKAIEDLTPMDGVKGSAVPLDASQLILDTRDRSKLKAAKKAYDQAIENDFLLPEAVTRFRSDYEYERRTYERIKSANSAKMLIVDNVRSAYLFFTCSSHAAIKSDIEEAIGKEVSKDLPQMKEKLEYARLLLETSGHA